MGIFSGSMIRRRVVAPFDPEADVASANLITWLEPDSLSGLTWADKSTAENDWAAPNSGFAPALVSGGAPYLSANVVEFDQDYVVGPNLSSLTAGEVLMLLDVNADPAATQATGGSWKLGSTTGTNRKNHYPWTDGSIYDDTGRAARVTVGNPTPALTSPRIIDVWSASGDWAFQLDGSTLSSTSTNTVAFGDTTRIGADTDASPDRFLAGRIRAVLIYDAKLSTADRAAVYAWLDAMRA
jgi:hypothetical protein